MVQKNIPYINKTGYSMFWNSMWDSKNNYSKNLQKDFFIKSFINFFFSDFLQNQLILKFNFFNKHSYYLMNTYNFQSIDKNKLYLYSNTKFNDELYISKIWLFKYHNWIIIYFFIFSKLNSYVFKKNTKISMNSSYLYNYLNNYFMKFFNIDICKKYNNSSLFNKNNF